MNKIHRIQTWLIKHTQDIVNMYYVEGHQDPWYVSYVSQVDCTIILWSQNVSPISPRLTDQLCGDPRLCLLCVPVWLYSYAVIPDCVSYQFNSIQLKKIFIASHTELRHTINKYDSKYNKYI